MSTFPTRNPSTVSSAHLGSRSIAVRICETEACITSRWRRFLTYTIASPDRECTWPEKAGARVRASQRVNASGVCCAGRAGALQSQHHTDRVETSGPKRE
eukprot:928446-Rhodomonas_salina.1